MTLKGVYNEEILDDLLFEGKICRLEYIYHHSQERIDDYKQYCQRRGLPEDETSAEAFTDFLLKREENAHIDGLD